VRDAIVTGVAEGFIVHLSLKMRRHVCWVAVDVLHADRSSFYIVLQLADVPPPPPPPPLLLLLLASHGPKSLFLSFFVSCTNTTHDGFRKSHRRGLGILGCAARSFIGVQFLYQKFVSNVHRATPVSEPSLRLLKELCVLWQRGTPNLVTCVRRLAARATPLTPSSLIYKTDFPQLYHHLEIGLFFSAALKLRVKLLDPSPPPLYIVTHTQHISGYISAPHPTVFWQPRAAAASAAASAADAAAAAARMSPPHPRVAAAMPCLRFTRWSSYQKPAHDTSLHAALQCRRRGRALVKMARQLLLRLHRWFLSRQPRASIRRLRANQPQLLPKITRK
jgi:hypothetical protein